MLVTGSLKVDVANNSVVVTKYLNPDAIPINGYSGRTKAKVEKATKALKHHSTGTWEVSTALPPPSLPTSCQRQSVRKGRKRQIENVRARPWGEQWRQQAFPLPPHGRWQRTSTPTSPVT